VAKVFRLSDVRRRNRDAVRRWRERSRKCQAAYYVDADDRVLSMLIRRRYIDEHQAVDKDAVRRALMDAPPFMASDQWRQLLLMKWASAQM
jgi:hypothetical protein